MKTIFALCFFAVASSGVLLKPKSFTRNIPADRLRDFPGMCFASTQCKVFKPNDGWSLAPFCGQATCKLVQNKEKKRFLVEQVEDCGPLVDLEATPGCVLLETEEGHTDKPFPDCCPQYECEEGAEVKYVKPQATTEAGTPRSS